MKTNTLFSGIYVSWAVLTIYTSLSILITTTSTLCHSTLVHSIIANHDQHHLKLINKLQHNISKYQTLNLKRGQRAQKRPKCHTSLILKDKKSLKVQSFLTLATTKAIVHRPLTAKQSEVRAACGIRSGSHGLPSIPIFFLYAAQIVWILHEFHTKTSTLTPQLKFAETEMPLKSERV